MFWWYLIRVGRFSVGVVLLVVSGSRFIRLVSVVERWGIMRFLL